MASKKARESSLLAPYVSFTVLSATADFLFGAIFVTILLGRGVDPWLLGLALGAGNLVSLLIEAPSGALGDRFGHRRLMVVGLALWGAGFALFGLANGLVATFCGMCLWAIGFPLQSGTLTALVVNRIGSHARTERISRTVRFGQVAGNSGAVLGAASVMVAGTWWPADTLVMAGGLLLVTLALLAPVCFPPSPGQPGRRLTTIIRDSARLVAGRRFLPLVALTASLTAGTSLLVVSWQPLLLTTHGEDVRLNGVTLLAMTSSLALGAVCARFVDRGRRPRTWAPMLAALVGLPLVLTAHGLLPLALGLVAAEFLIGLTGVLSGVWQQLMFTDADRNTMFSMLGMVAGLVRALVLVSFGGLWESLGLTWAVTVMSAVGVVTAVAAEVLARALPESTRFTEATETGPRA